MRMLLSLSLHTAVLSTAVIDLLKSGRKISRITLFTFQKCLVYIEHFFFTCIFKRSCYILKFLFEQLINKVEKK